MLILQREACNNEKSVHAGKYSRSKNEVLPELTINHGLEAVMCSLASNSGSIGVSGALYNNSSVKRNS